jgi:hypothetical protein
MKRKIVKLSVHVQKAPIFYYKSSKNIRLVTQSLLVGKKSDCNVFSRCVQRVLTHNYLKIAKPLHFF